MKNSNMKELIIGNLKAKLPIIQGGMGIGVSLSGLAASVANQGGIGVIAAAGIGMQEKDFSRDFANANIRALREHIQMSRRMSGGIIGVNIMVALSNFADMVKTAIDEHIDIIFAGAGLPLSLPGFLKENSRTKLVPIVSSGRAAKLLSRKWKSEFDYLPDAIVVEGPKAGGHLGFKPSQLDNPDFALENLVSDVIDEMKQVQEESGKKIPVIAAGGIYSGKDISEMIARGADGVQMATRFVPTTECDASSEFKQAYINSKQSDISIINSPVGLPGRAIMNDFVKDKIEGERKPFGCPYHCIVTCDYKKSQYCIANALLNAKKGNLNSGFAFAGQNAYRSEEIVSVEKLVDDIKTEYDNA